MSIKVGIIGFGCVGKGVVKTLLQNSDLISKRLGNRLEIKKICDRNITNDRETGIEMDKLTTNVNDVLDDPEIKIVVELIGGIQPAKDFLLKALQNGKHVVTANKKLLAEEGRELFQLAQEKKLMLNFEAAVGGAIPIIRTIKESFAAEKIEEVYGILNGTTNYILTKLEKGEGNFEEVLKEAQNAGYAEADPTSDIEGDDATHKIKLIAQLAFGIDFHYADIPRKGITNLTQADFQFAKMMHYKIKLLASSTLINNKFDIRTEPVLLKKRTELANIKGVTNAVLIKGAKMNEIILTGPGAGELPTASAVVGDIIEIARTIHSDQFSPVPLLGYQIDQIETIDLKKNEEIQSKYYFRVQVEDKPGVLAQISQIFAKYKISINAVLQNPATETFIPLMMILHETSQQKIEEAIQAINQLDFVKGKAITLRIADNIETTN